MLGIVFTGGDAPAPCLVKRLVEEEAMRNFAGALLVAADSGLAAAESAGLTPDWITGDFDSLDNASRLAAYPHERVIRHDHDKDYTDTELALSLALEKGCEQIWIIGGGGGRIDHLFAIRSLFEREFFPSRWITDSADIRCIDAHTVRNICGNTLNVRLERGASVSVFPLGAGPWEAKSEGLKWPLSGLPWERGFFGLSNVAIEGIFTIGAEEGRFMAVLPLPPVV